MKYTLVLDTYLRGELINHSICACSIPAEDAKLFSREFAMVYTPTNRAEGLTIKTEIYQFACICRDDHVTV